jgi:hypothetical protein
VSTPALAAGDASRSSCPNEESPGFRSQLPDCRAYELVSPAYKEGFPAVEVPAISGDGEHLVVRSLGAFAGTENDESKVAFGAVYEISREAGGWAAMPLSPPASVYPRSTWLGSGSDLSASVWRAVTVAHGGEESPAEFVPEDLLVRNHAGSFADLGPLTPPGDEDLGVGPSRLATYVGASDDLERILFRINPPDIWPGDATANATTLSSLYEYGASRTEPVLVGVSGSGPPHGSPHINEGAELISQCGTYLGGRTSEGGAASTFNAISASGASVFFTPDPKSQCPSEEDAAPLVNEVYVRLNETQTLDLSEPPMSLPGRECTGICEEDETVAAKRSAASFQGASSVGSRAYFTTRQPLVNGDEDEQNDLYGVEITDGQASGLVQVSHDPNLGEAAEVQGVARVSNDGSRVYFVALGALTGKEENEWGNRAEAGQDNLYVYSATSRRVTYIATLSEEDARDWQAEDSRPVQATSPEGRYLAFVSRAAPTGGAGGVPRVFEYDAETRELVQVSDNSETPAELKEPSFTEQSSPTELESNLSISQNGAEVFFQTKDPLLSAAVSGSNNAYEYRSEGAIGHGATYLISTGQDLMRFKFGPALQLSGVDASGRDVFFRTSESLVPQDTDTQLDLYDAREDGGFPGLTAAPGCAGEACQGGAPPAPALPRAGTELVPAGENAAQPPKAVVKPLTRAQKLAKALKVCREKRNKRKRVVCEKKARGAYRRGK